MICGFGLRIGGLGGLRGGGAAAAAESAAAPAPAAAGGVPDAVMALDVGVADALVDILYTQSLQAVLMTIPLDLHSTIHQSIIQSVTTVMPSAAVFTADALQRCASHDVT